MNAERRPKTQNDRLSEIHLRAELDQPPDQGRGWRCPRAAARAAVARVHAEHRPGVERVEQVDRCPARASCAIWTPFANRRSICVSSGPRTGELPRQQVDHLLSRCRPAAPRHERGRADRRVVRQDVAAVRPPGIDLHVGARLTSPTAGLDAGDLDLRLRAPWRYRSQKSDPRLRERHATPAVAVVATTGTTCGLAAHDAAVVDLRYGPCSCRRQIQLVDPGLHRKSKPL